MSFGVTFQASCTYPAMYLFVCANAGAGFTPPAGIPNKKVASPNPVFAVGDAGFGPCVKFGPNEKLVAESPVCQLLN